MSRNNQETRPTASAISLAEGSHRYVVDFFKQDGRHLGPISIEPDFQAAKDWTYFTGVRNGQWPAVTAAADGLVSPLWCEKRGAPYCRGVKVDTTAVAMEGAEGAGQSVSCEFPRSYFKSLAEHASLKWLEKGELAASENYTYHICAYPIAAEFSEANTLRHAATESNAFRVEEVRNPIPVTKSRLDTFRARATTRSEASEGFFEQDVPVFIAQTVLDESCHLAASAGEQETGGVLVGQLHQDASKPEIFVEVVAQIPAQFAEASGTSFSFTPETWAAADAAIALRGRKELIIGWWHSHPRFCNPDCPPARRKACILASAFFSADDIHLHRICFPQPYQVALLISDLPNTGPTPAVFGWRTGMVSTRGYYVIS